MKPAKLHVELVHLGDALDPLDVAPVVGQRMMRVGTPISG